VQLTPHFHSEEFRCRDGTEAPRPWLTSCRSLCLGYLEPLRREFGPVTILSGFRTATHNAEVGGAPASYHLRRRGRFGAAADVYCRRGEASDWYELLDRLQIGGLSMTPTSVHADNRRERARW